MKEIGVSWVRSSHYSKCQDLSVSSVLLVSGHGDVTYAVRRMGRYAVQFRYPDKGQIGL
jgi:hypothetical protein